MQDTKQLEQLFQNLAQQVLTSTAEANRTGNRLIVWLLVGLSLCSISGWIMAAVSLLWQIFLK